jgi:DNA-directed RNA polymerase subunit RPC12/RpoP
MPNSTYFVQECPTCGRKLQVRVEYLGKNVVCHHCSAKFQACDNSSGNYR